MATNGHAEPRADEPKNDSAPPQDPPQPARENGPPIIGARDRRCEIYKFNSDVPLYASAWSNKNHIKFRLAVGTITDIAVNPKAPNKVSIVQLKEDTSELHETASFPLEFPANAVGFIPDLENNFPDLLATTSDCLRLWRVVDGRVQADAVMNNASQNNSPYGSPLTSFDWNELEPRFIGVSSVDTTCTIYDIEVGCPLGQTRPVVPYNVKTQLIAHDKPVHDIEFAKINGGRDHFATVGADGSARMFDLRQLNHSTIVYEDPQKQKLQRLSWNKQEHYFLALFAENSQEVQILDIRMPCNILCRLRNHNGPVNGIAWAPHSPHHICTAADDSQALIWDLQQAPRPIDDPILAYSAGGEVRCFVLPSSRLLNLVNLTMDASFRTILPTQQPNAKQQRSSQLSTADDFRFVPRAAPVAATSQSVSTPRMIDQSQSTSASSSTVHPMHLPHPFATYSNPGSTTTHNDMGHSNVNQASSTQRMDPFNQLPSDLYGSTSSSSVGQPRHQNSQGTHQNQRFQTGPPQANDVGASTSAMHPSVDIYDNYGNASTSDIRRDSVRNDPRRKEIYAYNAPFTLFSHGWSAATDPSRKFRLAVSSFIEEYSNKIHIVQLDEEAGELVHRSTFDHPYPATKIMWIPDQKGNFPDLLATSGDYLRLWRVGTDNNARIESLLNTNRTAEYCAPLTSFDWNELDMNLIGTSSIDTTCTVWQLETGQAIGSTRPSTAIDGTVRTQLIAHDKEVFDISFSRGSAQIFASVGADGSLRLFDLRRLEHSTIMYEDPQRQPLLRLAWNRNDHNYIATFGQDSKEVLILDLRLPCTPVARLRNHEATINGLSWAPHSGSHICTAGDDYQALIWDVHEMPKPIDDPILAYRAEAEVNQIHWSSSFPDWISICSDNKLEILRV